MLRYAIYHYQSTMHHCQLITHQCNKLKFSCWVCESEWVRAVEWGSRWVRWPYKGKKACKMMSVWLWPYKWDDRVSKWMRQWEQMWMNENLKQITNQLGESRDLKSKYNPSWLCILKDLKNSKGPLNQSICFKKLN